MRTFHTGGVAGADITHGLPRVVELFEARKPKAQAHIAPVDGWVRITDDETRPGSAHLVVVEPEYIEQDDAGTGATRAPVREHSFPVMRRTQITVDDGQWVEAGDLAVDRLGLPGRHPRLQARRVARRPGHGQDGQGRGQGLAAGGRRDRGRASRSAGCGCRTTVRAR